MESEERDHEPESGFSIDEDGDHDELEGLSIPTNLPVLPLRDTVIFPALPAPLAVGRPSSVRLVDEVLLGDKMMGLVTQRDAELENPGPDDLYHHGTAASVVKLVKLPDGTLRVMAKGLQRFRVVRLTQTEPFLRADIELLDQLDGSGIEIEALARNLQNQVQKLISMLPINTEDLAVAFSNQADPGRLADMAAALIGIPAEEKQEVLATLDVQLRLEKVTRFLSKELEVMELGSKIQRDIQNEIDKKQREIYLREQLRAIQRELGEGDDAESEVGELARKLEEAALPEAVSTVAQRELGRLRSIPSASPEHNVVRTYLDWLSELPWSTTTSDKLDIAAARAVLDEDHFDLEKVKDRILEFLAVRKLKDTIKGPILCFVGPPGTGKTSLGKSIARALGRQFQRLSLGGVRDEAEIRGHRRTYVGALPGRIIQALRKAGSNNPLIMLDEIDKLGTDFRGDPSSALLEVLDPEQNNSFSDHYLDVPFDLSRTMFICTANIIDTIPGPLRDRMEVLELPGYTDDDKVHIARRYLVPRQIDANGLEERFVGLDDAALRTIVAQYTREAGLRNLEREIATICRKVARRVAEEEIGPVEVTPDDVATYLGPPKFFSEVAERTSIPGVSTGLAWTASGGDIIFVEATRMPGSKSLVLTGQLGDVMKESAQAALSLVRTHSEALDVQRDFFENSDIHIHVPAGAIPKDGPSAGVTMAVALVSLLSGRPCRADTAMTGEITLRGRVMPVGGIKEKLLAAHRAGIRRVILPARNEKDLVDVPQIQRDELQLHLVETVEEAIAFGLEERPVAARG